MQKKKEKSSEQQYSGLKHTVIERGQGRWIAKLLWADMNNSEAHSLR